MAFTTNDNAPYLYRRSGGGGDKEIDKLVGGTIAWNQILRNGNFVDAGSWSVSSGSSFAVSNNVGTFRADAQYRSVTQSTPTGDKLPKLDNVYMGIIKAKSYTNTGTFFYVRSALSNVLQTATRTLSTTEKEYVNVLKVTQEANYFQFMVQDNNTSGFGDITVQNARFFDLTLMFGSTIADYVYSLEQSSQGSGLAWLRSYGFFTEDYYDYNSGELKSVSNLVSHDMTGKNLLPNVRTGSTTFNGLTYTVNDDKSITVRGTSTALSYFTINTPNLNVNTTPLFKAGVPIYTNVSGGLPTRYTDGTYGLIQSGVPYSPPKDIGAVYIQYASGATVDETIYPMVTFASVTDDTYEPYTLHSYPLGDVTLRGLPKLNGNALYYDGDTYESNGTVTRKYGIVDLGALTWYSISGGRVKTNATIATSAKPGNGSKANIVAQNYVNAPSNYALANDTSLLGYVAIATDGGAVVRLRDGETTPTGYLVYELATPTTETADTYTNPQWVDPNGTERYTLSSNAFPMPVGHETTYNTDMGSKTVNTQVNLSMTEPQVRQIYAKEGDTARVLNIHLDQTEEDGTLRILRPDGTEVTADAVLVPEFYDGLMAEIPSDATSIVGKCYCDVEQNGVSSMPFTLNVKKNERAT